MSLLKEQGKTQDWLNAKMGAGRNCTSQMLATNNPPLSRITMVANALGMSASDLLKHVEANH
jgi:hypothetical protein